MNRHEREHTEVDNLLHRTLNSDVPPDVERRLRGRLVAFRERLDAREAAPPARRWLEWLLPRRLVLAGAAGVAVLAIVAAVLLGNPAPTWAKVVESFKSVPFFHATIYIKRDALAQPEQIELWMGRGGKARVLSGGQVLFADKGKIIKQFDLEKQREVKPMRAVLERLGGTTEFSLETLIRSLPGVESISPPLVNADASIADDLVTFDMTNKRTPEWVRIWALAESRLPVRVSFWDPRDGENVETLFSYALEQPAEFFDPAAFEKALAGRSSSKASRAYALLKDPGGRPITPEDVFQKMHAQSPGTYHMPELEEIGMTADGIVWVVSRKTTNIRRDGRKFYGFNELTDDLGRQYAVRKAMQWQPQDRALDIFIPFHYGKDSRAPSALVLTCTDEEFPGQHDRKEKAIVGTITATKWQPNAGWPKYLLAESPWHPLLSLAIALNGRRQWDEAQRILNLIPGDPATSETALYREEVRLESYAMQSKFAEAIAIGETILPQLRANAFKPDWRTDIALIQYVTALGGLGRKDEAIRFVKALREGLSPERRKRFDDFAPQFVSSLAQYFTAAEASEMVGFDVKKDERIAVGMYR